MVENRKIAIVHYLPLEFYPPATNFINYLETLKLDVELLVFSSKNNRNRTKFQTQNVKIYRYVFPNTRDNQLFRLYKYIRFNLSVLLKLIKTKPERILYYESYSSFPVYLYKKYFNSKVAILIHNHEYFDRDWYKKGMKIVQYFHKKEQEFLYHNAIWISQTNNMRLNLFAEDHPTLISSKLQVMPNYPSRYWAKRKIDKAIHKPLRIIYVGSLSIKNCYIKEFCNYVKDNKGEMNLDIYSYNLDNETHNYLMDLESDNICYKKQGIEYSNLSNILIEYDLGVILYKANSLNFKFNAPNKLFEYLSCGLDVWYPIEMKGIHEYDQTASFPKVIGIDFNNLENLNFKSLINREGLNEKLHNYFYETVYGVLAKKLIGSYE